MLGSVFNRQRQASGQAPLQCNLRMFLKQKQSYGFSEFLGMGRPALDFGLPGDIYLDLSPGNMALYGRLENAWEPWRGPDDTTNLICHPEHPDRCLWCNGDTFGWVATRGRLGAQGQGKTQSQLLAAAEEKARARAKEKEASGRKRKFSQDGEQQNKRVQFSTSSTPPPASATQITSPTPTQRRVSNSHPVPPASLPRTDNQSQSPRVPSSNTAGPSSLLRRTDSPQIPVSSATPRQASIAQSAGSPPRAAPVAGPSRIPETAVAGPSRIPDIGTVPVEILRADSPEEVDELDETEADSQDVDQLLDSDPAPAQADDDPVDQPRPPPNFIDLLYPKPAPAAPADVPHTPTTVAPPASIPHTDTTPMLDTAVARLSSLEPEQHYSASAIAAYLKPVLLELARLRQDARERDAAAVAEKQRQEEEVDAGLGHTASTPPLDTALSSLNNLTPEQHYSASAIATYLKPVLQELARLRQVVREHDAAAAEMQSQAQALREHDAAAAETRLQAQAVREAVAALAQAQAQEVPRANASQLAQARAEAVKTKEALQRAEERAATEQTAHSRLRALAAHDAELLAQRTREVEALRASERAAVARAKTADEELVRLRGAAEADAQRIEEVKNKVEALEILVQVQNTGILAARAEAEKLKGEATTAGERREAADDEIECWRSAAAASGDRVAVLEAENARLKAVEERCERAEAASREAQAEIGRLRVENASLREAAAVDDLRRFREATVTPRKPPRAVPPSQSTSRDVTATPTPRRKKQATTLTQHPPRKHPPGQSPSRQQRPAVPQPPDPTPSVEMLTDLHIDILCATVNGIALCRICLGSQPEVLTTFERSAFRDIHAHHMQAHRAEYAEFMLDDSQDLVALRRQITHPEDE